MTVRLSGAPYKLDPFLRPPARIAQVLLGGGGFAVLAWLGWWWWAPVPVVVAVLAYELFFWSRGDRAVVLELGEGLHHRDRRLDIDQRVDPARIVAAGGLLRRAGADLVRVQIVLWDANAPVLAVQLETRGQHLPDDHPLADGDVLDAVLGGGGRALKGLSEATVRQLMDDPTGQGLGWFLRRIPPEAWARPRVRTWSGAAPPLGPVGLHVGPPDGHLDLEGIRLEGTATSTREVQLVDPRSGETVTGELPLLVLDLGSHRLVVPAPLAGQLEEPTPVSGLAVHTHAAEGAIAVWHLLHRAPRASWPPLLQEAVDDARPVVDLPPGWTD